MQIFFVAISVYKMTKPIWSKTSLEEGGGVTSSNFRNLGSASKNKLDPIGSKLL